jgi:transposase
VVDAYVDQLDLGSLGFAGVTPAETGRPAYHPSVLLKIYIYGYLNRVQSSRRLEREAQRNIELMWLTERLAPDFKTIADFRRDNVLGIRKVCRRFVELCRQLKLLSGDGVAVDGSKFKAVNSRDQNFTVTKIEKRRQQIEESIERYLAALDTADRTLPLMEFGPRSAQLNYKLDSLREQMRRLDQMEAELATRPEKQVSFTDPDARAMATQAAGNGVVGYNVQAAVDTKHHLVVAHEVTNIGSDRGQLSGMARAAQEAMGKTRLKVYADRGYFNAQQIKGCADNGMKPFVPKPMTSNAKADGRFDRTDFIYIAKDDEYQCPAGERAIYRFTREENGLQIRRYWSSACPACPMKTNCTPSKHRRISRWEHEGILEAMQRRLDRDTDAMTVRRRTVEHVFGTLKQWMGATHFLTRRIDNVSAEMSLHVLAYNLKRVMQILGTKKAAQAMRLAGA